MKNGFIFLIGIVIIASQNNQDFMIIRDISTKSGDSIIVTTDSILIDETEYLYISKSNNQFCYIDSVLRKNI